MHSKLYKLGLVVLFGSVSLCAQDVQDFVPTFGVKIGVPVTNMFRASSDVLSGGTQVGGYTTAVPSYEVGVSGEFHLPYHLRFEVDGLYKRAAFASDNVFGYGGPAYSNTSFNVFEVPALFKVNVTSSHFRPFADFGASLRHIATIRDQTFYDDFSEASFSKNASQLSNRNSYGGVAGFGFTIKLGKLEVSPEARYTRWANQSFDAMGFHTNLNQGDVLLGIGF